MRLRPLLFLAAVWACIPHSVAQSVQAIAFNTADSIVLRWVPATQPAWEGARRFGYRVERVDVARERPPVQRITPDTVRPLTLEAMKARFGPQHPYAPIVAQAMYGDAFAPNTGDVRAQMGAAQQDLFRWSVCMLYADIDPGMADAQGLRWVDRDLRNDGYYLYRVISNDPQTRDTAIVAVRRSEGPHTVAHGPVIDAVEGERKVTLRWLRETAGGTFSAYWIERAQGSGPWKRLNAAPFVPTENPDRKSDLFTYTDTTLAADYMPHRYRVLGITPFGMVSPEATVITAMGRDRTAPPNPVMKEVKDEGGKLVVHWAQETPPPDLKGFRVEKAMSMPGQFFPLHRGLLPKAARQFTDTSSFLLGENHYRVWAVDTAGNESVSLNGYGMLADSIAPAPPVKLKGSIDTTGVVTVHWPWGREKDILGYRVFFANAADHHFNNLTPEPVQDTVFRDTIPLRTLTKDIFYRVVAVDRNFNHSGFSATLHLKKPDVVPPVAPVIERYAVSDTAVVLHFVPSSSNDVMRHELLRRSGADTTWHPVTAWAVNEQPRTWTDRTVRAPEAYTYALQAVDSAGLRSPLSVPLEVRMPARPQRPGVASVSATQLDQAVQVAWNAPPARVKHYVIYRTRDGGRAVALGSAPGDATLFADVKLPGAGSYRYAVKAVYPDGGSSPVVEMAGALVVR